MSHEFWLGLVIGMTIGEVLITGLVLLRARLDRVNKGGTP